MNKQSVAQALAVLAVISILGTALWCSIPKSPDEKVIFNARLNACKNLGVPTEKSRCLDIIIYEKEVQLARVKEVEGLINFRLGKYDDAKTCFEKAVYLDPGNEQYRKDLSNIDKALAELQTEE